MKKFIIALALVFIAHLSCKKLDKKDGLCACSPIQLPGLSLVVKNAGGADLLNAATTGFYSKNQISLYYKDANGLNKAIEFTIRPTFTANNVQFNYNQLYSSDIVSLAKSVDQTFYLKLGNDAPFEINLQVNQQKVEKVLVNKNSAQKETSGILNELNIFYLVK